MKRLSYFALLSAFLCLAGVNNVWAQINYDCAIQTFTIEQSENITQNLFTITFSQKGKSRNDQKWWGTNVTLVLESNDRTLEGLYSSSNASGNNSINTTSSCIIREFCTLCSKRQ